MTIEFHCTHCDKTLKTSDDKAGRQAKCPGCGELIEVPSINIGSIEGRTDGAGASLYAESPVPPPIPFESHHDQSANADEVKPCPACGETIGAQAIRCRHCGVVFQPIRTESNRLNGRREIRPFPPGEVVADAWRIFTERMGLLIGSFLVMGFLTTVTGFVGWMPFFVAEVMFDRDDFIGGSIASVIGTICLLGATAFAFHLQSGYLLLQVKSAREQPTEFGDLFSGGRFFLRYLLNSIVFSLIVGLGAMLCIIPGMLLALMLWPFGHALVDEDRPGLNSLSRAKDLTDGNWGSLFLIFIVAGASILAGYCVCGIGLIVAMPFVNMLFAVAYDRMSCQTDLPFRETVHGGLPKLP